MGKAPKRKGSSTVDNPHKRQKITNDYEESTAGGPLNPEHQSTGGQGKGIQREELVDEETEESDRLLHCNNHAARLGLLNSVRITTRSNFEGNSRAITLRIGDKRNGAGNFLQDMEAQQMESFFMELMSDTTKLTLADADNRVNYVKPYMRMNSKLKDWRKLSLIMRLNLIESLLEIEKAGSLKSGKAAPAQDAAQKKTDAVQEKESWKKLQEAAGHIKYECVRAQIVLNDPKDWEEHEARNDTSRVNPDEPLCLRPQASGEATNPHREPAALGPPKKSAVSTKPETKKPAPEKKTSGLNPDPELPPFTDEQQKFFDSLVADKERDSDKPEGKTASTRAAYKQVEIDFCKKFVKAKNESGAQIWGATSDAMKALSRAHRRWFTNYPLPTKEGEPEVEPYRAPHAMYRKFSKDEPFKMLFKAKVEEAESSKAPATSTKEAKKKVVKKAKPTKAAVSKSSTGSTNPKALPKKDGKTSKPKKPNTEPIAEEDNEHEVEDDKPEDEELIESEDEECRGELLLEDSEEFQNRDVEEKAKGGLAKKAQAKKGKAKELPIEVSEDSDDDDSDNDGNDDEPGAEKDAAGHPTPGGKQLEKRPPGAEAGKNAAGHPITARKGAPKASAGEKVAEVEAVPESPIEGEKDEGEGRDFEGEEDEPRDESNDESDDESDDSTEASEED
jgi:hypothetical protein